MAGRRYEFRVAEPLTPTALAAFPELTAETDEHGAILFGVVRDNAELHGILDRFFLMHLTVVGVSRLTDQE